MWFVAIGAVVFVWRLTDYVYDGAITRYVIGRALRIADRVIKHLSRP